MGSAVLALWLLLVGFSGKGNYVQSQSQQEPVGFINIDCGAPNDYHDDTLKLYYKTDKGFVGSGKNMNTPNGSLNKQAQNLRYFPDGKRNCYTLRPEEGKGNTYLIRASFYYGNYDQKDKIPVFDLHIGVNYWATVNMSFYTYEEVIFFSKRDDIQVCLIKTGEGIPFISALELRLLDNSTYHQKDLPPLVTNWRYNIGGPETYRSPSDVYDRIWTAKSYNGWQYIFIDETSGLEKYNDAYKVPPQVLKTAQKPTENESYLSLSWPSNSTKTWCVYFHFAELEKGLPQKREFSIQFAGEDIGPNVVLEYLTPQTVDSTQRSSSKMDLTLTAADNSNSVSYPPILNAVEFFDILDQPEVPTAREDVDAVNGIKKAYVLNRIKWQGDPCVPNSTDFTWDGLCCSYVNTTPRIVSLNLSSSNLGGFLDASFSNLVALESLDLSHNNLIGAVPDFSTLPNLRFLDLSGNNLKGSVPQSLLNRAINRTALDLRLADNPDLCLVHCNRKNKIIVPVIASVSVLVALLIIAVATIIWRIRRKQGKRHGESSLKLKNRPFTYREVLRITDGFRTCIGEGGYGKVYLGTLADGTKVAVKMLSQTSKQGYKEFQAEAQPLMIIHHKNLVSLIGYCDDAQNTALLYELMEKGNLRQHLSDGAGLAWRERVRIALDAAQGLDYLHNGCKPPIIHRDLKTPNILLDETMQAKIADFGLSKVFQTETNSYIPTRPAGTVGYLDPEFQSSGNLSKKSDVYSFGIVLFELITGQPAVMSSPSGNVHILQRVTPIIRGGDIKSIVDPLLNGKYESSSAWKLVEIAMSCVPPTAIQRPDISQVLAELKECWALESASQRRLSVSFSVTDMEFDHVSAPAAR